MPVNLNQQTVVFLSCILTGFMAGIICDLMSIPAQKLRFCKSAVFIKDILVWINVLALFFSVIYALDGAVLRWYVFLGAFSGALIYLLAVRKFVVRIISRLTDIILKIIDKTIIIITLPLRKMVKKLKPVAQYVQNVRKKKDKFVQKNIEKMKRIKVLLNKI